MRSRIITTCEDCNTALATLYAVADALPSGGWNTNSRLMVPSSGKRTEVAFTAFLQHCALQVHTKHFSSKESHGK